MSSQVFAGDTSGSVTIQCPAVAGSNVLTLPLSNGLIPGELVYVLGTTYTGTQATTAQTLFGLTNGITLASNTNYQCEYWYTLTKSAGTNSHSMYVTFGGTATFNNFTSWVNYVYAATGALPQGSASAAIGSYNGVGGIAGTGAITTAVTSYFVRGTAIISVNAGGTFLPQYVLSAAPGGAYTTQPGSYIKLSPLGTGSSGINIGSWS